LKLRKRKVSNMWSPFYFNMWWPFFFKMNSPSFSRLFIIFCCGRRKFSRKYESENLSFNSTHGPLPFEAMRIWVNLQVLRLFTVHTVKTTTLSLFCCRKLISHWPLLLPQKCARNERAVWPMKQGYFILILCKICQCFKRNGSK
jgi:hypothetical protein